MKLRFDKNSIRLRVKKSDIEILRSGHSIRETVCFPGAAFNYGLLISKDTSGVSARMEWPFIEVTIPEGIATAWINSDETGVYQTIAVGNNQSLDIIIEKDFPCKDQPGEDQSDLFGELSEKEQQC